MKYPIEPLTFRLLVLPEKVKERSKGGIIIGTEKQLRLEQVAIDKGKVLKLGPAAGRYFEREYDCNWPIEEGDYILFKRNHGMFIKPEEDSDKEYVLLNDEDVLAKLDPNMIEEENYE